MYHTIAGEGQTQFVREKARNKGVFALRRPQLRAFARRSVRRLQEQRRLAGDERRLGLLQPRHRLAGLARQRDELDQPRREQRLDPRREVGRHPQLALRRAGEDALRRPPGRSAAASALTHMPRPGSRPARSGHHLVVRPGHEADQPRLRPGLAGDDAAPLRLVPRPSPAPRASPPQARSSAASSSPRRRRLVGLRPSAAQVGRVDPAELDAGVHHQRLRLLEAHVELLEQARCP